MSEVDYGTMDRNASGGWSKSGTLRPQGSQKLTMQADFSPNAGSFTVQFQITDPNDPANSYIRAVAQIEWAVDGNTNYRKITVAPGTSVSGVGQAIRVAILDDTPTGAVPAGGWKDYDVTVTVAPGTRASDTNPPLLTPEEDSGATVQIAAGGSTSFAVPDFSGAKSVMVMIYPAIVGGALPLDSIQVQQLANLIPKASYDPRLYAFTPLIPGTTSVKVTNHNVGFSNSALVSLVWGIDG